MVIQNHNIEQKAISAIEDIFNTWCSDRSFPYNADTSDLRSNDRGKYYDGQIVINYKLAGENKGLRFFIQLKGTTASSYSGMKNYKELLRDVNNHKMPTFLFIVYLERNTLEPKKFEFLFLNEKRMDDNFSIKNCTRIKDLKNKSDLRNAVEEIIGKARRYYFYSLSNRLVNNIPVEIHNEVDNYNNLLDREFHSVKKSFYPDIWKFSIFYNLQRGSFGRAPIPFGYSSSLIQEIPLDNHFWQEICDRWGDFNWNEDKLSSWLLQRDLEICIKNKLFDLSCLNGVPRFERIKGMNIEVSNDYVEKIFLYLVKNFEDSYDKFCQHNFPLLKDILKLSSCTILSPKVTKPNMPRVGWNHSSLFRKHLTKERITISNEYDKIEICDSDKIREAGIISITKGIKLYCSEDILIDSIYLTLTNKLEKLGYISNSFSPSLSFATGVKFE